MRTNGIKVILTIVIFLIGILLNVARQEATGKKYLGSYIITIAIFGAIGAVWSWKPVKKNDNNQLDKN